MPEIASMTLEQLQDYALKLEAEKAQAAEDLATAKADADQLRETNLMLQNRNNELFLRVEQAQRGTGSGEPDEEPTPETCEDFALKNIKNIMR